MKNYVNLLYYKYTIVINNKLINNLPINSRCIIIELMTL